MSEAETPHSTKAQPCQLSDTEKDYLSQFARLKMCVDPAWMPFEKIENGEHIGMAADYIAFIEQRLPFPIELVPTQSWTESLERGKARECDIFSLVMPTPERKTYLNFTTPYLKTPLVIVTQTTKPFVDKVAQITDKKLGVVRGYAFGELLRTKYPKMQIIDVDNLKSGLELVNEGKIYGMIGTLATTSFHIQREYIGELKITGKFDETWDLGIGVRNDKPELASILSKIIEHLPHEVHQKILNNWVSVIYEKNFNYDIFWRIMILIAIILLALFYAAYRINKAHQETQKAYRELKAAQSELKRLVDTDHLTQIYNRYKLDKLLTAEFARSRRNHQPLSIILFDIDYFKKVNDDYGHLIGDDILVELSEQIQQRLRETDAFGRWGGEEFLIICPDTDVQSAHVLAENLRANIEQHTFTQSIHLTISLGVASCATSQCSDNLTSLADEALYKAKSSGRNQVQVKAAQN